MDANKFTKKSLDAINAAQSTAVEYQNQRIEQEHLLYALTEQENGLISQLWNSMGADSEGVKNALLQKIAAFPKVTGSGREMNTVYVSSDVDSCLNQAEQIAKNMHDDYVSVEHIVLALFNTANSNIKEIFKAFGIDKDKFLDALSKIRGNQRVQSDNPEKVRSGSR